ncbi:MAG: acyl-CoA thioesterase [Sandarakinorhabdus sp.]|nr:acyl-CoA thioesterase [Sandarakinorhabdus sp.]
MTTASRIDFRHRIEVGAGDIDHMGHVNNAVYLKWVQAAVIAHWRSLASVDDFQRYLWIARSHEIRYNRPGFLGDRIAAVLRIESVRGALAEYRTLVEAEGRQLAAIRSTWCCIDALTRRPVRVPAGIIQLLGLGETDGQRLLPAAFA